MAHEYLLVRVLLKEVLHRLERRRRLGLLAFLLLLRDLFSNLLTMLISHGKTT
jgi:hypothetical protein